ncbi:hypothetical protein HUA74_30470 [Myxococcus sp. CA051A]|uniref:hypothetical protein n=1 Tax=unclassified Myxococcus TaxID=2648731 RepID=UPI00157B0CAB|nr:MULTISPECIES: hypothetical protein [unclassified Myxococcus]NTX06395.1 hypothetical protein [Myxococcus sp. CA040A]NTX35014.1 hypothetical protein [Myxococcus sp. CA033]NTX51481.1 hypothetical protein [Myxococcus sp. CA039A]NTX64988.1 hypothetical protein [Myxococcus sp. CA051A]
MNGWLTSSYRWLRRPRSRGQALTEFSLLLAALIVGTLGLSAFAPDIFAVYTIYVRGFYVVLGYPLG